jgi:HlyD family secretion protein
MNKNAIRKLLATALLATALSGPVAAQEAAAPTISVLIAKKKPIASTLTVTGSFAAVELVLVLPQVEGLRIEEVLAEEGDAVKKGQVLAKLSSAATDVRILQTKASMKRNEVAIEQAKNQIEQAKINEDRAASDLNRTKKLRTTGVSTVEQFDQRLAAYNLANSQLSGAELALSASEADLLGIEAQMKELELLKSRTEIKSPVDGFISKRNANVGGIASASRDPMFSLVQDGKIKLLAEVAESDLPKVKVGQKVSVVVSGVEKAIPGEVRLISAEVNQTTRVGIAHVQVAPGSRIPLGSFGRAEIALAASDGVILPLTAVTFGEDGPTVQVIVDGVVAERKVITGLVSTTEIEITNGVSPGEQVVARSGSFVRNGDKVTPVAEQ